MWYWRPGDYKSVNRKPGSMEYIRFKYGSDVIDRQETYELEPGNIQPHIQFQLYKTLIALGFVIWLM